MNIEKLKDVVQEIQFLKHCGASDSTMIRALVEYLYDESNGKLIEYFTMIDDIRKEQLREEKLILQLGLQDAMHSMSHMSEYIDEGKTKDLKALNKLLFDPTDGNIAFLINIAKAYFPDGTYGHASNSGVNFFNKFRALLRKHKDQYLTGDSKDWAKMHKHYDYIKLVLEKDPDVPKPPQVLFRKSDQCPFYLQPDGTYTAEDEHGIVTLDPKDGNELRLP